VVHTLVCGLADAGHDVLLVASGDSTSPVPTTACFEEAVGMEGVNATIELAHAAYGCEEAERWGADILHDHTLVGAVYAIGCSRLPVVTTNHGPFQPSVLGRLHRAVSRRVGLIAISHHQASTAPAGTRIDAVVHHGIDLGTMPMGAGGGGFALFLGRMSPSKGIDRAIRIARLAGMPLVIAAKMRESAEEAYFDEVVRPLLGPGVEFVGEVGGDEKLALLGRADVLLNPIEWDEPFGMVMIEALAAGTPVVAAARGSVPEIVDDGVTGYVRNTDEELAATLADVGSLDRRACRRQAELRFSAERMVRGHLEVYRRLATPQMTQVAGG
jgi:glycosyltransferase involved in cell wall biosynthesis